jgi:hypothetical protein
MKAQHAADIGTFFHRAATIREAHEKFRDVLFGFRKAMRSCGTNGINCQISWGNHTIFWAKVSGGYGLQGGNRSFQLQDSRAAVFFEPLTHKCIHSQNRNLNSYANRWPRVPRFNYYVDIHSVLGASSTGTSGGGSSR